MLLLLTSVGAGSPGVFWATVLKRSAVLLASVLAWTPIRIAILISLILHRTLRADAAAAPNVGSILVSAWLDLLLLAGPALLLVVRMLQQTRRQV